MAVKSKTHQVYEMQAQICGALANPTRLQILDLLAQKELTSTDLLEELEIPKANLSQHLSVLREAGLVKGHREGTFQVLSLALPRIKDACNLVQSLLVERLELIERENQALKKELKKGSI